MYLECDAGEVEQIRNGEEVEKMAERREIVFSPNDRTIVVRSPEDLATKGVGIHEEVIRKTWGPQAIERYRQARIAQQLKQPSNP